MCVFGSVESLSAFEYQKQGVVLASFRPRRRLRNGFTGLVPLYSPPGKTFFFSCLGVSPFPPPSSLLRRPPSDLGSDHGSARCHRWKRTAGLPRTKSTRPGRSCTIFALRNRVISHVNFVFHKTHSMDNGPMIGVRIGKKKKPRQTRTLGEG